MASYFLYTIFFINVFIIFPAISLIPLLLVGLNNSFISGVSELSLEYDSRALLIIGDTIPAPWSWFNCSSALFKISPRKDGTWLLPIILFNNSLILSSDPLLPEDKTLSNIFLTCYTS